VNNAFLFKLNARLESQKVPPLVDLGTCSLHPVHAAFRKAVEALPFDVEQFATDIYHWFKLSSACREDYELAQKELQDLEQRVSEFFLKFISSRWLYLESVCRRIIDQFAALRTYFLMNLRRMGMKSTKSCSHVSECSSKQTSSEREGAELYDIACDKGDNWLQNRDMEIRSGTKCALAVLPDDKKKTVRLDMRKSLKVMGKYLKDHLPLRNAILHDLQCLHPLARKADAEN